MRITPRRFGIPATLVVMAAGCAPAPVSTDASVDVATDAAAVDTVPGCGPGCAQYHYPDGAPASYDDGTPYCLC